MPYEINTITGSFISDDHDSIVFDYLKTRALCLCFFLFLSITGSDEDAIIAILGARTSKQRQEIAAKFEQEYSKV